MNPATAVVRSEWLKTKSDESCVDWCRQFGRCQVWIPLTWRRSNMVFSSYVVGLFGLFILEFSLWNNFGNYIWYVSIGFTILDMVIGDIVSYQLKEVSGAFWTGVSSLYWRQTRTDRRPVGLGWSVRRKKLWKMHPRGWQMIKRNNPSLII